MSTFKVKLEGSNVVHEGASESGAGTAPTLMDNPRPPEARGGFVGGVYRPPTGQHANSLHRMGNGFARAAAERQAGTELTPVWEEDRRGHGEFKYRRTPIQREPEQPPAVDPVSQQIGELTGAVKMLADRQLGIKPDQGPQLPDPETFDFYDPGQVAEFHRQNLAYIEHAKQEALRPHQAAIQQTELANYYNEVANEYRDHPNFRDIESAVQYALRHSDGKTSLREIFANAVDPAKAKPGWAGNIHTPKAIRGKLGSMNTHHAQIRKAWGR